MILRRFALTVLLGVTAWVVASSIVLAQSAPEFKLGFKLLASQVPDIVGQPLENEHFNPANGDSLQQTSKGLMVWRKADNWTAFTDGARTWINGPYGVQDRSNDERFAWEKDASPVAAGPQVDATPTPIPAPTYAPTIRAMDKQSVQASTILAPLLREIDTEWAQTYGWKPSRPTTIYLFFGKYAMADGFFWITGTPATPQLRDAMAEMEDGTTASPDVHTGGYAAVVNVASGYGSPQWESSIKHILVHEYAHIMEFDSADSQPVPRWYEEGLAEHLAYLNVPDASSRIYRMNLVLHFRQRGALPSLRELYRKWRLQGDGCTPSYGTLDSTNMAYGVATLAVDALARRAGERALVEILRNLRAPKPFEMALQQVAGCTLEELQADYLGFLDRSAPAIQAAAAALNVSPSPIGPQQWIPPAEPPRPLWTPGPIEPMPTAIPGTVGLWVNNVAPDFTLRGLDGQVHRLSDYRGKPVVLTFWTLWCDFALQPLPFLDAAYKRHQADGLRVLTVPILEDPNAVQTFVNEKGYSFLVLPDVDGQASADYAEISGGTWLIDGQGIIRGMWNVGYGQDAATTERSLEDSLKWILTP